MSIPVTTLPCTNLLCLSLFELGAMDSRGFLPSHSELSTPLLIKHMGAIKCVLNPRGRCNLIPASKAVINLDPASWDSLGSATKSSIWFHGCSTVQQPQASSWYVGACEVDSHALYPISAPWHVGLSCL